MENEQPLPSEEEKGLLARKHELETRLAHGEELIRQEREKGTPERVAVLERHWVSLLREYEQVCERLGEMGE